MLLTSRSPAFWERSLDRGGRGYGSRRYTELLPRILGLVGRLGVPTLPVPYEALLLDPEGVGGWVAGWLGVEYRGWPERVYDGNEA